MSVSEVKPKKERAQMVRRILGRSVRNSIQGHGNEIAGFALVTWNMRGEANSSYLVAFGAVSRALMPSYVKDRLLSHAALDMAQESEVVPIDGGA